MFCLFIWWGGNIWCARQLARLFLNNDLSMKFLLDFEILFLFSYSYFSLSRHSPNSTSSPPPILTPNRRMEEVCEEKGLPYKPWVSCRVSQIYHTGACVYFYFGFVYRGVEDPVHVFEVGFFLRLFFKINSLILFFLSCFAFSFFFFFFLK